MEELDKLIERGKHTWFLQNDAVLEPILIAIKDLDDGDVRTRSWKRYFDAVKLHYQQKFLAADEALKALQLGRKDADPVLTALIARNRAVVANLVVSRDPLHDLEQALELAIEAGDEHTQGTIEYNLGFTNNRFGDTGKAIDWFTIALNRFTSINDPRAVYATLEALFQAHSTQDTDRASQILDQLVSIAKELNDPEVNISVMITSGMFHNMLGEYRECLASFEQALDTYRKGPQTDIALRGMLEFLIADAYWSMGEHRSALEWAYRSMDSYKTVEVFIGDVAPAWIISAVLMDMGRFDESLAFSLKLLVTVESIGNPDDTIAALANIGQTYYRAGDPVAALEWLERARILMANNAKVRTRVTLLLGMYEVHRAMRHEDLASEMADGLIALLPLVQEPRLRASALSVASQQAVRLGNIEEAERYLQELEEHPIVAEAAEYRLEVLMLRAKIQRARGEIDQAIRSTQERIDRAEQYLLRHHELDAHVELLYLYKAKLDVEQFFDQYERVDELTSEIRSLQQQRQITLMGIEREYASEREQSIARTQLLNNVLPEGIAERILNGATIIADEHDDVAVIFLDIVSFTDLAASVPPGHVIHLLNAIFQTCDEVMRDHGITKIKTIGDAYLAVAGAPASTSSTDDQPSNVAKAAYAVIELRARLDTLQVTMPEELGDTSWTGSVGDVNVRIGCHVGSVVAGVVGTDRVAYDVWGDAVNIAARMEQTCEPGRIQVSDDFAKALPGAGRPEFDDRDRVILTSDVATLVQRGNIPIKGKGDIKTWWLV